MTKMTVAVFRLMLLLLGALVASPPAVAAPESGWTTYRHPEHGFTISYPPGWLRLSGDQVALLILAGPSSLSGSPMTVNVVGGPVPPGATSAAFRQELEEAARSRLEQYQPLRTDRVTIAGQPTAIHYFTWLSRGRPLYGMQVPLTSRTHMYILTGAVSVNAPGLAEDLRLWQRIIASFRLPR